MVNPVACQQGIDDDQIGSKSMLSSCRTQSRGDVDADLAQTTVPLSDSHVACFYLATPSSSPKPLGSHLVSNASKIPGDGSDQTASAPLSSRQADIDVGILSELGSAISRNVPSYARPVPPSTGPSTPTGQVL